MMSRAGHVSPALSALAVAAANFSIAVDAAQLQHRLGQPIVKIDAVALCRCAGWIGLRARCVQKSPDAIARLPLPLLFPVSQGWCVLLSLNNDKATVYFTAGSQQRVLTGEALRAIWQGTAILLARLEPDSSASPEPFGFSWFVPLIIKHARQLRQLVGVTLLLQAISLVTPVLSETLIDNVLVSLGADSLVVLGMAMLALAFADPGFTFLRGVLFSHLSGKVGVELDTRLYRHLLRLPLGYFADRKTGHIIARLRETDQVRHFMTGSVLILVLDVIFTGLFIAMLFHYSVQLTWLVIATLLCCLVFWFITGSLLRKRLDAQYRAGADTTAFLTEMVTGIETLKVTATEPYFLQRWQQYLAKVVRTGFQTTNLVSLAVQGISVIQKISMALLLWFGVRKVLEGELTPGQLVAFNMLAGYATQPVLRLAHVWQEFQRTLTALKRSGEILDHPAEPGRSGLTSLPEAQGHLRFEQVTFRYRPETPEVLLNVTLEIRGGEFIGITGPSGSGKSTVSRLLQRLYTPQQGKILIDGQDLAVLDMAALRCRISVVLQESVLFAGSVLDNICLCCPDASLAEAEVAAKLAGAHDFICSLAQGYHTAVGEKGALLSGGQRQRIALARALMTDPRILILDEATSALDYESEAAIMRQLPVIRRERTVICIAHRLHILQQCDRIILLKQGGIKEAGTHGKLLSKGGDYARLWQMQMP